MLYPGLLVVNNWDAYRRSAARLKRFADDNEIKFILGAHIEMTNQPGKWFGYRKTFHPGDTTAEGVKTVHWHKNAGSDDVLFATADLVKKPAN